MTAVEDTPAAKVSKGEAAATDETDLSNYQVVYGTFGPFTNGDILPLWWLTSKKHHIPTLLADGVLVKTDKPVNCDAKLVAAAPKPSTDATPSMQREIDRLKRDIEEYARSNAMLTAQNTELKEQHAIKDRSLGEQTIEIGRLKLVAEREKTLRTEAEERVKQLTGKVPAKDAGKDAGKDAVKDKPAKS